MALSKSDRRILDICGYKHSSSKILQLRRIAKEKLKTPKPSNQEIEEFYLKHPEFHNSRKYNEEQVHNDENKEPVHITPSEVIERNVEIHDDITVEPIRTDVAPDSVQIETVEPIHNSTPIEDVESIHTNINVIAESEIEEPVHNVTVELIHTKSADMSTVASKYAWKTIAFNTTDGEVKTRHVIKLDLYYVDALAQIGFVGKDVMNFLSNNVNDEWNETIGDKSITKMVKRSIVQALLDKIPN